MNRIPDLREIPELPDEIVQAALDGNFVLFVGSGVSKLLGLPSWDEMARLQLEYLREEGVLNYSEIEQLGSLDPKRQLSIAKELADENKVPLKLKTGLTGYSETDSIYKSINDIGCVCVTTNYDELLAPRYNRTDDGSETSASTNRIYKTEDFHTNHLDTPGTVIHLHGSVIKPKTMVVTTSDYLAHYDNDHVQEFLRYLFEKKTVLFIGYGLDEAEILEHIFRRGRTKVGEERKRFVLQGYFMREKLLYERLYKHYKGSFGVHMLGYIRDHKNYKQQEMILEDWIPKILVKSSSLAADMDIMDQVLGNG